MNISLCLIACVPGSNSIDVFALRVGTARGT